MLGRHPAPLSTAGVGVGHPWLRLNTFSNPLRSYMKDCRQGNQHAGWRVAECGTKVPGCRRLPPAASKNPACLSFTSARWMASAALATGRFLPSKRERDSQGGRATGSSVWVLFLLSPHAPKGWETEPILDFRGVTGYSAPVIQNVDNSQGEAGDPGS